MGCTKSKICPQENNKQNTCDKCGGTDIIKTFDFLDKMIIPKHFSCYYCGGTGFKYSGVRISKR